MKRIYLETNGVVVASWVLTTTEPMDNAYAQWALGFQIFFELVNGVSEVRVVMKDIEFSR